MAWMQWMAYLAWRGGPRLALACSTGSRTLGGTSTMSKIQGIKLMVRWLLGVKNNQSKSGNSTLRMLTAILHSDGDLTEQGKMGKPDMSRLRLAAACALLKLAQEPCYHEIITLEHFSQKLHRGLCRLRLPLEYLAMFALCAKDPVKERRAHARQCLVKNVNIRREYLKQHAAVSEKLFSLLPEYVVPYSIHLLVHDPDYVKVQDLEQLKEIKESLWFVLEIIMAKNENNSHAFIRKMVENIKQTKDAQAPGDAKINEKLYTVCDVAMNIIMSKSTTYSLESPKDPVLPSRYFTKPDKNFSNTKNYLPPEMKSFFTPGKLQSKASRMETTSNDDPTSNPSSPQRSKTRHDSTEMDHSENEDISLKRVDIADKWPTPDDQEKRSRWPQEGAGQSDAVGESEEQWDEDNRPEDEQNSPPKKRRGRPPKSAAANQETPVKGKRGRKKAAPPPEEEEEDEEEREDEEGSGTQEASRQEEMNGARAQVKVSRIGTFARTALETRPAGNYLGRVGH
ncbi:hypothetical protein CRUP_003411 [Coryphaenoides rupestris]|nr:hypothetical protein CRUP_003411 [Coryphaenoides rupestris]